MIILFPRGDLVRIFFPSRPQYAILGTGILGQMALSERRLRGAAQTLLALPYPFRTWPGSGTWAERDKREVLIFFVLGGIRLSYACILAYAELERKTHIYMGKHIFPSWHRFQIGILFRPHHTFFMVIPRSVWPIVVRLLCRCFSIHGCIPFFERSLSSRGAVPYPTTSLHPVSVLILHPGEIYNLLLCGHRL